MSWTCGPSSAPSGLFTRRRASASISSARAGCRFCGTEGVGHGALERSRQGERDGIAQSLGRCGRRAVQQAGCLHRGTRRLDELLVDRRPRRERLRVARPSGTKRGISARDARIFSIRACSFNDLGVLVLPDCRRKDLIDGQIDLIDDQKDPIDERFDLIDERFDLIDERFDPIDERFDPIDKRFDPINERFDPIDKRFDSIAERIDPFPPASEPCANRSNRAQQPDDR
jgi:hypothetical protein